jgi:hypothetical protein
MPKGGRTKIPGAKGMGSQEEEMRERLLGEDSNL